MWRDGLAYSFYSVDHIFLGGDIMTPLFFLLVVIISIYGKVTF